MLLKKMNLLIFLVVFLIISITPVSASLMYINSGKTITESLTNDETSIKSINNEINEINRHSNSLKQELDNKTIQDKIKSLPNIFFTINKIEESLFKFEKGINNLKEKINQDSYFNNIDQDCEKEACHMADELTKLSNTTFKVKKINASELKKGDIVQYLSQGKYPRYLIVQDITFKNNTENKTGKQLLDYTDIIPVLSLKGTGDKTIELPCIGEYLDITPEYGTDPANILQDVVKIQEKEIGQIKSEAEKSRNTAQDLKSSAESCRETAQTFHHLTFCLLLSASITVFIPEIGVPLFVVGVILHFKANTLFIKSSELEMLSLEYENKANELNNTANLNEKDLTNYTKLEDKNLTYQMNITTFDGIPIIKHPPINDWKEYQFILVKNPEHGTVLPGPGLQFLYGPTGGYTGHDTFVFQYLKDGKIVGTIDVNIIVNPIPVFTIPPEEED